MNTQIIYFQFKEFYVPFMTLQSNGFNFFAKIMKGSCIFYCSSCISFNPTRHLKNVCIRCFPQHGTICAIYKKWKHSWRSVTFSKVAALVCNFNKRDIPPWVFFTFLKLYKWYHTALWALYVIFTGFDYYF